MLHSRQAIAKFTYLYKLMKGQPLLKPYKLGNLLLKNSMVMAPLTRDRSDNTDLAATELTAIYYQQRSTAGLIISEGTNISKESVGYINVPGIYSEAQIKGWRLVTDAVHNQGGKIFAQLWHVGRLSHPDLLDGNLPLAPSAINPDFHVHAYNGSTRTVAPKEMSIQEIQKTVLDFKTGAENALKAGFDGVELHAANGYLLHQFFNLSSNHRKDDYGGSFENRSRILFEILDQLKEVIDMQRVGVRFNPSMEGIQGMNLDQESIPVHEYIIKKLNDYDLAYIHLANPHPEVKSPFLVREVAKHFRPFYQGTIIANNGYDQDSGNKILEDGYADLVSFGRLFLANPDLVERFEKNALLNQPDPDTFYTTGAKGYTDYPFLSKA